MVVYQVFQTLIPYLLMPYQMAFRNNLLHFVDFYQFQLFHNLSIENFLNFFLKKVKKVDFLWFFFHSSVKIAILAPHFGQIYHNRISPLAAFGCSEHFFDLFWGSIRGTPIFKIPEKKVSISTQGDLGTCRHFWIFPFWRQNSVTVEALMKNLKRTF